MIPDLPPADRPADQPMPLLNHLVELRERVLRCVGVVLGLMIFCYWQAPFFYGVLVRPLAAALPADRRLIYTHLPEVFFTYLQVALCAALMLAFPYIAWQLWRFVAPGLYAREKSALVPFLLASPVLFGVGLLVAYGGVIPLAWQFFIGFEQAQLPLPVVLEARVGEYLSLALSLLFAFGLAFQLPLVLLLLIRAGTVRVVQLRQARRYVVVAIFVIAAILTPPDIVSQLLLALPLWLFFELVLLWGRWLEPPLPVEPVA